MDRDLGRTGRRTRRLLGLVALAVALWYLARSLDPAAPYRALRAAAGHPLPILGSLLPYAAAFALRAWAWCRVLPGLDRAQSWAALHVSLLGNHVLPFRLGEALRVTSVLRRTDLDPAAVTASAVMLRTADVLSVLGLAALAAPRLVGGLAGGWAWPVGVGLVLVGAAAVLWLRRQRAAGANVRLPTPGVAVATVSAWLLESAVVWAAAAAAGVAIDYPAAVAVTAVTIAAQAVALTPGGVGSYEAAATAALVGLGAPAGGAFAAAVVAHAVKTAYSVVVGVVALVVPEPGYVGRLRLPRHLPPRPPRAPTASGAPVVVFLPAHDEEATVGDVVRRLPAAVAGHPVVSLVVDDGSQDATAARAEQAGARVLRQPGNLGLGAAVRRGLSESAALRPACVVYLDADGEYQPEEVERLARPVLSGAADYVVGSRFAGEIRSMRPHRRFGNAVLTRWVRWMTRLPELTDGQSGFRAFSPEAAAAAEVVHDYNYAQVLTLDLLAKGFTYAEVPIAYAFRASGTSFVRLGRYLRRVLPAVYRELNPPRPRHGSSPCRGPDGRVARAASGGTF